LHNESKKLADFAIQFAEKSFMSRHTRCKTASGLSQAPHKASLGDFPAILDSDKSMLELELAIAESRTSAAIRSVLFSKPLTAVSRNGDLTI
jgi:hypothetical protein